MIDRKSLENRIRGWFPQEPYFGGALFSRMKIEIKQPPLMISPDYKLSATVFNGVMSIVWVIAFLWFMFAFGGIWRHAALINLIAWLIVGSVAGITSGGTSTHNQLKRLSKNIQITPDKKDMLLYAVPMFAFLLIVLITPFLNLWTFSGFWDGYFAAFLVLFISKYALFYAYEKERTCALCRAGLQWV